ncbi:YdcF family protein [Candidatus Uhrbacteria bacterium]|nr:YdcF family protein [Candidatus Uhrbacteria bacterium]
MSLQPFYHSAVVVFCGPHDEGEYVPMRRIDQAILLARNTRAPLLVAGDGNYGSDVQWFARRAGQSGIAYVRAFYDERASTLADAQRIADELLVNPPLMSVVNVHLVTDDWHMNRATAILAGELARALRERKPRVTRIPVRNGPRPPAHILEGERQGLEDYLAGRYGQRRAHAPYGKPCEEAPAVK